MIDVSKVDYTKLYDYATKIVQMYRDKLDKEKVDASGQLSRTADFDLDFDEYHVTVYLILESYYHYIEVGRQRSTGKFGSWSTKYADIERWLRQKIARGSFIPTSGHTIPRTDKEIKSVSYLIARKVTNYGFYNYSNDGKHLLEQVLDEVDRLGILDDIIDEIVDAYSKRVEVEMEKI
jgi:hypothetical protein